jgi:transposase
VPVAVTAHSAPALRQVGVEDQAVVLHLLTKRREDLVAVRTQTINWLHRLLMDLVPGGARRTSPPSAPPCCWPWSRPPASRRSPATSWPLTWSPTCVAWISESQQSRGASRPWSPSPTPAWSSCSGWGPVLAAVFVAEIGNVHRFAGAPQLCSWAGLTPRHRESDTTVRRLGAATFPLDQAGRLPKLASLSVRCPCSIPGSAGRGAR